MSSGRAAVAPGQAAAPAAGAPAPAPGTDRFAGRKDRRRTANDDDDDDSSGKKKGKKPDAKVIAPLLLSIALRCLLKFSPVQLVGRLHDTCLTANNANCIGLINTAKQNHLKHSVGFSAAA